MLPVWGAVLIGLALSQVAFMVTTVFLHRALSHRALQLRPAARMVFRVLTWVLTGIRPRQWVAVHRLHHAYTDTPRDPHSPIVLGTARVLFANAALYRRAAKDPATARYARDLPQDRWDRVFFDHAVVGLGLGIGALVLLLGWQAALIAAGVHAVTYLLGGGAINAIGHRYGKRPQPNLATNNQWLAWLVAGEGLHNNHHARPTAAKLKLRPGEVDPGWWCIRALVLCRQAVIRPTTASGPGEPRPGRVAGEPLPVSAGSIS
ncbi:fatty acid desaturase [Aciditerrimonas ferrireducens]|jgi:stearoyl-CoA desaturase (delta-9 desaturase)|uniref:Fatty acid desaturase n=1 Tax=Aciditerrimonas ferrireducens TaxID=667306 RepID=A0ABV6BYQ8_9ACTN